jgi:hypothetical protein
MKSYSSSRSGAGITQLAECQLPKLNVAGSIPVTRSIALFISILLFSFTAVSASGFQEDFWLRASGNGLLDSAPTDTLTSENLSRQINSGNRIALVPLVQSLVASGRIEDAEVWMQGRGIILPVTRRDLGIALSWYGRFELYNIMSSELTIPGDLADDDYSHSLAAILYAGWMNCSQDGSFHPDLLIGHTELELLADEFFPSDFHWEKDWIGMGSLDSLFDAGSIERTRE